jgi:hypothetical protein
MNVRALLGSASTNNGRNHGAEMRDPPRPSRFWPHTVSALARHVLRTVPWATLLAGSATGTALLAVLDETSRTPLGQGSVRLTFLPAVAALAFVPRTHTQALAQAAPLPTWVIPAAQSFLAIPVVAVTCWAQLLIMTSTIPASVGHAPAVYPLVAQFTGWCAIAVAAAAVCERSRYSDLGGAVAAPVTLVVVALAWVTPGLKDGLALPLAAPVTATIAWCSVATGALAVTIAGMRDRWHRHPIISRRMGTGGPPPGRPGPESRNISPSFSRNALPTRK